MNKPSFIINESSLKKLSTKKFTKRVISKYSRTKTLENLDLSDVDFSIAAPYVPKQFDGWTINNVIFSRYNPKSNKKKHLHGLSFKGATMNGVGFAQAYLEQCNFDDQNNRRIDFFYSDFSYCRFIHCHIYMADFRYAKVSDCSMRRMEVTFGDFYFCGFKGNCSFQLTSFFYCSFTNAVFEHDVIREESIKNIIQDDYEKYQDMMNPNNGWFRYNPCGFINNEGKAKDEEAAKSEAIEMYKQLSGIYAGKGLIEDSNKAYTKMKKSEIEYCKICIKNKKNVIKNTGKILKEYLIVFLGYGYKWKPAALSYAFLIFIGAVVYTYSKTTADYSCCCCKYCLEHMCELLGKEAIPYSFLNSFGSYNQFKDVVGPWMASFQTLFGIILLAYIGFIFANKMRNSL